VDILLPPHPIHLATLGLLDNEIGIATLGYIVGPPIVPRFPSEAMVQEMAWLASVDSYGEWEAVDQSCNWLAELDSNIFDLEGLFGTSVYRAIIEVRGEFQAILRQKDALVGIVEAIEESASLELDGKIGSIETDSESATVQEAVPVGSVKDKPGEGCC